MDNILCRVSIFSVSYTCICSDIIPCEPLTLKFSIREKQSLLWYYDMSRLIVMLTLLFIVALWSPAGKGLTSWLLCVMFLSLCYFTMWYPGSGVVLYGIDS